MLLTLSRRLLFALAAVLSLFALAAGVAAPAHASAVHKPTLTMGPGYTKGTLKITAAIPAGYEGCSIGLTDPRTGRPSWHHLGYYQTGTVSLTTLPIFVPRAVYRGELSCLYGGFYVVNTFASGTAAWYTGH